MNSNSQNQGVPPYVSATNDNYRTEYTAPTPPPPPPAYHDANGNALPGQTYYQPPPTPLTYPPPPLELELPGRNPVAQFYSPPDNRKLALRRRVSSCMCCIVIIVIIVGLAAGLTRSSRYNNRYCECRTNSDCVGLYGPGVYCYQSCECATV